MVFWQKAPIKYLKVPILENKNKYGKLNSPDLKYLKIRYTHLAFLIERIELVSIFAEWLKL